MYEEDGSVVVTHAEPSEDCDYLDCNRVEILICFFPNTRWEFRNEMCMLMFRETPIVKQTPTEMYHTLIHCIDNQVLLENHFNVFNINRTAQNMIRRVIR